MLLLRFLLQISAIVSTARCAKPDHSYLSSAQQVHLTHLIGFEASASDGIRLKWAYYLSLLELNVQHMTNHAGLVIFDEPGQQAADPVNLTSLFQESANPRFSRHQILIATSEKELAIRQGLGERPYNLITFDGYILKPMGRA